MLRLKSTLEWGLSYLNFHLGRSIVVYKFVNYVSIKTSDHVSVDIPPQMKILDTVIPIVMFVPSKDTDQPEHPPCLIRVLVVHMKIHVSSPVGAQ